MARVLALTVLGLLCTSLAAADTVEPRRHLDDPLAQTEGMAQKPYVTGGPLPKSCTREEWNAAIEATVAATKDIPLGATAEFVRRANEVAARFGC